MPSLDENLDQWEGRYEWAYEGDEWSGSWGGTGNLWWGTLRPRLRNLLPTETILELAPGFGRWTQFLKDECQRLVLVDLSEKCIAACRARFSDSSNVVYHVNDGRSLEMVEDGSIDLAFSFDSLVHVEADVLAGYLAQLASKLTPDGVAFIHHSNMGEYRAQARLARRVPARIRPRLVLAGALVNVYAWRAESVTAELFERMCEDAGLACVGQEKVTWEAGRHLIDCLSTVARPTSRWARPNVRVENRDFMREAATLARLAPVYGPWGASRGRVRE
jgi:ubiquinone/menaquinone biosynthesis C-methylase UbiE